MKTRFCLCSRLCPKAKPPVIEIEAKPEGEARAGIESLSLWL